MENERPWPFLMTVWFQPPANTTISGWQQSEINILLLHLDFEA